MTARPEPSGQLVGVGQRRPYPLARRRQGSADLDDTALLRCLAALRADPEWTVFKPLDWPPVWIWQVVYHPTGHIYTFRAERIDAALWRFLEE